MAADDQNPPSAKLHNDTAVKSGELAAENPAALSLKHTPQPGEEAWNSSQPDHIPGAQAQDRSQLLERARNFLASPQVRSEDALTTRRFLVDKGLTDAEIDKLLYELVSCFSHR
jgi:hypothetical protein